MPIARFEMPDGRVARFEVPDGTTPEQAQAAISARLSGLKAAPTAAPAKPFGQQLNDFISDAPRQLGLTARHGIEGVGDTFDAFVGNPLRTLASPILGNKPTARTGAAIADLAGLPQPQNATERVVGDATRMLAGGAGMMGAASKVGQATSGMTQKVAQMMAANPSAQLASAGAAGAAGGYTRETGGNEGSQLAASVLAGIATPFALAGAGKLAGAAQGMRARPAPSAVQVDVTINNAIEQSGLNLGQLPAEVAQGIRADVSKAMQMGGTLSPDAVRRLADYRLTGATPTAAKLTLDPAMVTQQENLAKLGINSKDAAAQQLGQTKNANNRALTQGLNQLGASTADDAIAGGSKIIGALQGRDARAQQIIGGLYDKARDSAGRSAQLDHVNFTNRAADLLHDSNVESFLTPDIRNKLNGFASGQIPLTVEIAEQFKTGIGRIQRNSTDGNTRHALGLVRQALDDTPLLGVSAQSAEQGGNQLALRGSLAPSAQNVGQEAIDAFGKARSMNRKWMQIVEKTPALQAVRDGIEPDKFVQQFVIGGGPKSNVMDVAMLKNSIKGSPEAVSAVRTQITSFLKQRALNGADDEVGNFSQSAYNKALDAIGERKLKLFFSADDINQMKAIGRVAAYEQFQPAGSAVNNSNTAAAGMAALLDRVGSSAMLSKVPFGKLVQEPLQNIAIGINAKQSLNVPRALTDGVQQPQLAAPRGLAMSPAALMGIESEESRKRRKAGLLLP